MRWNTTAALISTVMAAGASGADFQVNTFTTNHQRQRNAAAVAASPATGDFVVVWRSIQQSISNYDVYAQRFAANGTRLGAEFRVNTYTTGPQYGPAVAMDMDGKFVVVWQSRYQDGDFAGVFGQRFDAAGSPIDVEFQVNSTTQGFQYHPDVAIHDFGRFTVVWATPGSPIRGQRFDAGGARAGSEFTVNATSAPSSMPTIAGVGWADPFVVTWVQDGATTGILARAFSSDGTPRTGDLQANDATGVNRFPSVDIDGGGRFVVAWESEDYFSAAVRSRKFDENGVPIGPERVLDWGMPSGTLGLSPRPSVALLGGGEYVVAYWEKGNHTNDVVAKKVSIAQDWPRFRLNSFTTDVQESPAITSAGPLGDFVVTWNSRGQDGSGDGIFGTRIACSIDAPEANDDLATTRHDAAVVIPVFANDVATNGDPLRVRFLTTPVPSGTVTAPPDYGASVTYTPAPGFVGTATFRYTAHNDRDCADEATVTVQVTNAPPVAVSDTASTTAGAPAEIFVLANDSDPDGDALAILDVGSPTHWGGTAVIDDNGTPGDPTDDRVDYTPPSGFTGSDGFLYRIRDSAGAMAAADVTVTVQAPTGLAATRLRADPVTLASSDGNGLFEPGETAIVAPHWLNTTVAAFHVTGSASGLAGAPGSIIDPGADYGLLAPATESTCGSDCYRVRIEAGPRPATHWDASFVETLSNGDVHLWPLHLGDSFGDVPRASPFYRFVETLLHRQVTAGCAASLYCPQATTWRDQLAVFVLVAKEGPTYAPPACGTPMFSDVPADSPYCRWIEELARRGVVAGCGSGRYCPLAPVSREQMAVFVLAAREGVGYAPPACGTPLFSDVPPTSPFCRWIEELTRRGIVAGCGSGLYCPLANVTREQMSVFLGSTFGLTLYGP